MYKSPSKRKQGLKLFITYGIMTAAVLFLVTSLVFVMLGYRFNKATSTIEQGGLVQFNTRPTSASVTIGSAKLSDRTPSKITVNPGTYTVKMAKNGYHDWSKSVDVDAGQVLWLNYAQLVPTDIKTQVLAEYDDITNALASPNGDRYAVTTKPDVAQVSFIDVTSSTPKLSALEITPSILPKGYKSLTPVIWASDSNRLLIEVKHDRGKDWLLVDRRDSKKTVNLSAQYAADISEALFDPRSSDKVIIRTKSGEVRLIDTGSGVMSSVMASSVTYMTTYMKDALLVVQQVSPSVQSVGYISFGSNVVRQLQSISNKDTTRVAGASYFRDPYISISNGTKLDVYRINRLPSSSSSESISMTKLLTTEVSEPLLFLGARSAGRFVTAQHKHGLLTYDLELRRQSNTSFTTPTTSELRWLDRYHFYLTNGTSLERVEFDGGNPHVITKLSTSFDAISRENGKYIYAINKTADGKYQLQRSKMTTN